MTTETECRNCGTMNQNPPNKTVWYIQCKECGMTYLPRPNAGFSFGTGEGEHDMNTVGDIRAEQVEELEKIRNQLFNLHQDINNYGAGISHVTLEKRVADMYSRLTKLYMAVDFRPVDRQWAINTTGAPCIECLAPEGAHHFDGCQQ